MILLSGQHPFEQELDNDKIEDVSGNNNGSEVHNLELVDKYFSDNSKETSKMYGFDGGGYGIKYKNGDLIGEKHLGRYGPFSKQVFTINVPLTIGMNSNSDNSFSGKLNGYFGSAGELYNVTINVTTLNGYPVEGIYIHILVHNTYSSFVIPQSTISNVFNQVVGMTKIGPDRLIAFI